MMQRKLPAIILVIGMLFSLAACGSAPVTEEPLPEPYAAAEPAAEAEEMPAAAENEPEEEGKTLDFDAAYAAYAPETIVFYVEGVGVTWQELFYEIAFYTAYIASMEGKAVTDWSDPCSFVLDGEGNPVPYENVVMQNATGTLLQYHIMDNHFREAGVVLSEEAQKAVETVRQTTIEQAFGGNEEAFLAYLESLYCTEELWNWFNEVDALYNYDGFDFFSGEMGSYLPDAEVMEYADGDENGGWTEYVQLKLICMYDEGEATASEDPAASSGEPVTETDPEALLVQILSAEDPEAVFNELYAAYNEEPLMDHYPDGRCVYQGDINDMIYQTARTMDVGECRLVSLEGTDVIVMKMSLDPDGGVNYDEATGTMYTLRYYAACQAYAEMTGGADGWIATYSSEAEWAEGFENFSLDMVF